MHYFIYRISRRPIRQLAKLEQHESYREASARVKLLRNELMPQPEELEDKPRRSLADLLGLRRKEGDNGAEE